MYKPQNNIINTNSEKEKIPKSKINKNSFKNSLNNSFNSTLTNLFEIQKNHFQ
jgi:hypothetical protein